MAHHEFKATKELKRDVCRAAMAVPNKLEVANHGPLRPPLIYLGAIIAALIMNAFWPLSVRTSALHAFTSILIALAAVLVFAWAVLVFKHASTPVPGNRPTTTIVLSGPYRFSRNPIYLAFSMLQLAVFLWTGNIWTLATLCIAVTFVHRVVIAREERYLQRYFGEDYLHYKASVRCWL